MKFEDRTIDHSCSLGAWGYLKLSLSRFFSFSGRSMGLEYGLFCFFAWACFVLSTMIGSHLDTAIFQNNAYYFTMGFFSFSLVVFGVGASAAMTPRLNDAGLPNWLCFLAFVGPVIMLLALLPSVAFTNHHGPHPKAESGDYRKATDLSFLASVRKGLNSFSWLS